MQHRSHEKGRSEVSPNGPICLFGKSKLGLFCRSFPAFFS